jgi:ornithine carbamoyltransferase
MHRAGETHTPQLPNRVLAMMFAKSSTRTRVSFEAGMAQLGGHAMFLSPRDTQLGRGEPIEDTARVISSMVDVVMIRTFGHDDVERFAAHSSVPVINALTDDLPPLPAARRYADLPRAPWRHPRPQRVLAGRWQQHVPLVYQRRAPVRF